MDVVAAELVRATTRLKAVQIEPERTFSRGKLDAYACALELGDVCEAWATKC